MAAHQPGLLPCGPGSGPVLDLVREIDKVPTVTRPRLTLMELRREDRWYEWEVIVQQSLTCD